MSTPEPDDVDRWASRRTVRWVGVVIVLVGVVLLALGFRDWGTPSYAVDGRISHTGRLVAGLCVGAIALLLVRFGGARHAQRVRAACPGRDALPLGCTDATCWFRANGALVDLDGHRIPRTGDTLIGPSVVVDETPSGRTDVYS